MSNRFVTMHVARYVSVSVVGLLAGASGGGICGLLFGSLLAFGYHRHGPCDPGDAPVYVSIGLMMVGACLGAIIGFVIAIVYSVRLAQRCKVREALQGR